MMKGMDKVLGNLNKYEGRLQREVGQALLLTAQTVRGDAIKSIQRGPATGITRTRGNITHTSSAPGEAPATDTGRLSSSLSVREQSGDVLVFTNLKYAKFLEMGTVNIAERPFLLPALNQNRKLLRRLLDKAHEKAERAMDV